MKADHEAERENQENRLAIMNKGLKDFHDHKREVDESLAETLARMAKLETERDALIDSLTGKMFSPTLRGIEDRLKRLQKEKDLVPELFDKMRSAIVYRTNLNSFTEEELFDKVLKILVDRT